MLNWFAVAAGVVLAAGLAATIFLYRSTPPADTLARDAIGDHQSCALMDRMVRMPVPLEQAAQQFDGAYQLLRTAPPDGMSTSGGPIHVVDRHSCSYGARRFGHVIMDYKGRVVSLLMTANEIEPGVALPPDAVPHVIGRPMNGLSVVSVAGSHHAFLLVGDLGSAELTQLSAAVSVPLAQRLEGRSAPGMWSSDRLVVWSLALLNQRFNDQMTK
jgi:hypothetical protein